MSLPHLRASHIPAVLHPIQRNDDSENPYLAHPTQPPLSPTAQQEVHPVQAEPPTTDPTGQHTSTTATSITASTPSSSSSSYSASTSSSSCSSSSSSSSVVSPLISPLNLVWVDCEMSGLESYQKLLEIAVIITDSHLTVLAESPSFIIHQDESVLNNMDGWCKQQFGTTLIPLVRASTLSTVECETELLRFIQSWTVPGASPLCGNTVYVDRQFIAREMPALNRHFHYRIIDVSSIKELVLRWLPNTASKQPKKAGKHRAIDDIRESINELKFYRENCFVQTDTE